MARGFEVNVHTDVVLGQTWIRGDDPFPKGEVGVAAAATSRGLIEDTADLRQIAQLADLRGLVLGKLPPDGLRELLPLKNLTSLTIPATELTDADIALLPSFSKLTELWVHIPNDAALATIATLPHLSRLTFNHASQITASGLRALEAATTLSQLDLTYTNISREAAQAFATVRPDVIVIHGGERLFADVAQGQGKKNNSTKSEQGHFALTFDGEDDHVEVPTLRLDGLSEFTIEARVRPVARPGKKMTIVAGLGDPLFALDVNEQGQLSGYLMRGRQPGAVFAPSFVDGSWHTVAATVSGSKIELFLDGKPLPVETPPYDVVPDNVNVPRDRFLIGAGEAWNMQGLIYPYQGEINELRVSRTVRHRGEYAPSGRFTADKETLALYHFDEVAGPELKDSSGNNHHGKIVGAKWVRTTPYTERESLDWLFSVGATVGVGVEGSLEDARNTADVMARKKPVAAITLDQRTVSDDDLAQLTAFPNLLSLRLAGCSEVGDSGMQHMARLPQLKSLALSHTNVGDQGLLALQNRPELRVLHIGPSRVTAAGMTTLGQMSNLYDLNLTGLPISDASLAELEKLPNLNILSLVACHQLSNGSCALLARFPLLQFLDLNQTSIGDAGVQALVSSRSITSLILMRTKVTDDAIRHLSQMRSLKSLNVQETAFTAEGIKRLASALPQCTIFSDHGTFEPNKSKSTSMLTALEFDGQVSHVELPMFPLDSTGPLTIEAWFTSQPGEKPNANDVDAKTDAIWSLQNPQSKAVANFILDRANTGWWAGAGIERFVRTVYYSFRRNDKRTDLYSVRHHAAFVRDGDEVRMFVDGIPLRSGGTIVDADKTPPDPSIRFTEVEKFLLGAAVSRDGKSLTRFFHGSLDEFRISKSARYSKPFTPEPVFSADAETVAVYHFDEGQGDVLTDSSGNNHHGKIVGAKWVTVPDDVKPVYPLEFDGVDDHVAIEFPEGFLVAPITIEAICTPTSTDTYQSIVSRVDMDSISLFVGFKAVSATVADATKNYQQFHRYGSTEEVHLAVVHDGGWPSLFVDGKLVGERRNMKVDPKRELAKSWLTIGAYGPGPQVAGPFKGQIKQVRITRGARFLTDTIPLRYLNKEANTIALYRFNEGSGDVLKDSSGNNHHGKIVGAKWISSSDQTKRVTAVGPVTQKPPFVTLRNGAEAARYSTFEEALTAGQPEDVIEVHGNGPFPIGGPLPVGLRNRSFTIKGANGFRPLFIPAPATAQNPQNIFRVQDVTAQFEGIDFVSSGPGFIQAWTSQLEFRQCRLLRTSEKDGLITMNGGKLVVADCLLFSNGVGSVLQAFTVKPATVDVSNSAVFGRENTLAVDMLGHSVRLDRCTTVGRSTVWFVGGPTESRGSLSVEVSKSLLFNARAMTSHWTRLADVRWQGKDNVYGAVIRGESGIEFNLDGKQTFEEWIKSPAKPETGSKQVPTIAKPVAEFLDPDPAVMFGKLKTYLEELRSLHPDVGADPAVADEQSRVAAASDGWLDVLPLVDPQRDKLEYPNLTGKNDWQMRDGELLYTGDAKSGKLVFPVRITGPHVEVEFGVTRTSGGAHLNVDLPSSKGPIPIELSRGGGIVQLGWPSVVVGRYSSKLGQRITYLVKIEKVDQQDVIDVFADGVSIGHWQGQRDAIGKPDPVKYPQATSSGFWMPPTNTNWTIHRVRVRAPGGVVEPILMNGKKSALTSPPFQQWMKDVAAMSPDEQVKAVAQKLQELNSDFDGKVTHTIKNGAVFELSFSAEHVRDISPVRALTGLKSFGCRSARKSLFADLSPLQGLSLTTINLESTSVSDLSPLRGMPLTSLNCGATAVADLSPLRDMPLSDLVFYGTLVPDLSAVKDLKLKKITLGGTVSDLSALQGMPLTAVSCGGAPVSDLSPLRGMALTSMDCQNTKVTDLTPLQGMPLTDLRCDFVPARDTEMLRSFKTLKSINYKPAAEFWKSVESPPSAKKL